MRMLMPLDQIVEEAGRLPTRQVVELVERLSQWLHLNQEVEESWKAETRQRIADIAARLYFSCRKRLRRGARRELSLGSSFGISIAVCGTAGGQPDVAIRRAVIK